MAEFPTLTIHTDGASRGNPGAAAYAYVIQRAGAAPIEAAGCLGQMTNNQAEYIALVRALECALQLGAQHHLRVHSDSELMVKQMKGEYRVKNEDLRDLYQEAQALRRQFQGGVTFLHVPRASNSRADALCNEALDGKRGETIDDSLPNGEADDELRQQAVDRLQSAAAAWSAGSSMPAPQDVWEELVQLLRRHGVKVP
jgi:ribonuclease HI